MTEQNVNLYGWPNLITQPGDPTEQEWLPWAYAAREEMDPVYSVMYQPIPDNPVELDQFITEWVDGWLPRAQFFAVKAEFYLAKAKGERYPRPQNDPDTGKPITAGERDPICPAPLTQALADYFQGQGAATETEWHSGGHDIRQNEIAAIARFLKD